MKRQKTFFGGVGKVLLAGSLLAALGACTVNPPPLDWQMNAQSAAERAVAAYLSGNNRVESLEFERMRRETARTGDATLMARAELLRCATRVASLVFEPCDRFEALRPDASLPERAYADYLGGRVTAQSIALLPPQHQAPASRLLPGRAVSDGDMAVLVGIADPLARLVAAGVWLQAGQGHPAVMVVAADTASVQGWSRPLLAWLQVQARHAELGGDTAEVQRLRRRMELVLSAGAPVVIKP